mgnify:CR=1 FL=1
MTRNKQKGLLYATTTAFLWGILPIALIGVLVTIDPFTTTFFRFLIAAVILTPALIYKGKLKYRKKYCRTNWTLKR